MNVLGLIMHCGMQILLKMRTISPKLQVPNKKRKVVYELKNNMDYMSEEEVEDDSSADEGEEEK